MRASSKQIIIFDLRSFSKHPVHDKHEKQAYMKLLLGYTQNKKINSSIYQWKDVENTVVAVKICCK